MNRVARVILLIMGSNVGFLGGFLLSLLIDPEAIRPKLEQAFQAGQLVATEARQFDRNTGWDLFSDCVVLHMLIRTSSSPVLDAVAPPLFLQGDSNTPSSLAAPGQRLHPWNRSATGYRPHQRP